ncbi:hypothetical protein X975_17209, partial [Stegodyphus mimosarum]
MRKLGIHMIAVCVVERSILQRFYVLINFRTFFFSCN